MSRQNPIHEGRWYKKGEIPGVDCGIYKRDLEGLEVQEHGKTKVIPAYKLKQWKDGFPNPVRLPSKTKYWWMLTEEGKEIALRIKNPNYDEGLRKQRFEEWCLQRCETCFNFSTCELIHLNNIS